MIILVGIGCFMAGAVVGIVMMSLCVASHNSSLELPKAGDYFKGHVLNESTIKLLNSYAGSKISITEASL